ncbi:MAG: STAS domain-containing protein [bacterium]
MLSDMDTTTGVRVVVPRGNLLGEEVETLRRRLGEALIADVGQVVVDMRPVRYASARALGILVAHLKELRYRGGDLRLLGCRPSVRELFDLCGIGPLFEFLDPAADLAAEGQLELVTAGEAD